MDGECASEAVSGESPPPILLAVQPLSCPPLSGRSPSLTVVKTFRGDIRPFPYNDAVTIRGAAIGVVDHIRPHTKKAGRSQACPKSRETGRPYPRTAGMARPFPRIPGRWRQRPG